MNKHDWLITSEACELLRISESTLRKKVMNRTIPFYKFGGKILFKADELQNFIKSCKVEVKEHAGVYIER